jgi:hypothetical protein
VDCSRNCIPHRRILLPAKTKLDRRSHGSDSALSSRRSSHPTARSNHSPRYLSSTFHRRPARGNNGTRNPRRKIPGKRPKRNPANSRPSDRRNRNCGRHKNSAPYRHPPRDLQPASGWITIARSRVPPPSLPLRRTHPPSSQAQTTAQLSQSRSLRLRRLPGRKRHRRLGFCQRRRRAITTRIFREPLRTLANPHSFQHRRQSALALAAATGRAPRRHAHRRGGLHRSRHPRRFPALRHLSHPCCLGDERNHPGLRRLLDAASPTPSLPKWARPCGAPR